MDFWVLILNVVVLLALALLFGLVLERFKLSAILGYLVAGAVLGPGALNLISTREAVSAMAELGVALLLFTVGLEFSWSRLRRLDAHAFGLSPALGAFGAGFLLAETPFATPIRADIGGLRTLFVALFFVSIGMLADLRFVRTEWAAVAGIVAIIVVGKAFIIWVIARLFRHSHRNALATGICLAQVGEFSFVLAQTGLSMGILDAELFQFLISTTVFTLFLSPMLVAAAPRVGGWMGARLAGLRAGEIGDAAQLEATAKLANHVVVVGMGPSGRGVMDALSRNAIPMVAVDLNARAVESAREQGILAELGNASQEEILDHVQAACARAVVVTVPDHQASLQIVCQVRALAPRARIIARARYHVYADELENAGAHVVVDEEEQMGYSLGRKVIACLRPGSMG